MFLDDKIPGEEGEAMSRAFVRDDEDAERIKELIDREKKLMDWLKIQEKKLSLLESGEKAGEIDKTKRKEWLQKIKKDIEDTTEQVEKLRKEIRELQKE